MSIEMNGNVWTTWEDVRGEIFTPEEIAESDLRVARIGELSATARNIAAMVDMLPEEDKKLVYEIVKKLVLAWDPDYSKVTPEEKQSMEEAEKSGFISEEDIDWDKLGH